MQLLRDLFRPIWWIIPSWLVSEYIYLKLKLLVFISISRIKFLDTITVSLSQQNSILWRIQGPLKQSLWIQIRWVTFASGVEFLPFEGQSLFPYFLLVHAESTLYKWLGGVCRQLYLVVDALLFGIALVYGQFAHDYEWKNITWKKKTMFSWHILYFLHFQVADLNIPYFK